ncbi:MAG: ion transporter [Gammaproteobacteria bacterium]|nr:ion transporter [Gammaproteobacteria bacterium]
MLATPTSSTVRVKLNRLLFDLRHPAGRNLNLFIIFVVICGVVISMLATVPGVSALSGQTIWLIEVGITMGFAVEYLLRLYAAERRREYAFGFFGLVDLFTVLPLLFVGDPALALRLLRILRLFKLARYLNSLWLFIASMRDVIEIVVVAISSIGLVILLAGNIIFLLEPATVSNAFEGVWWSLVTMTTVGYGDIVPQTIAGKLLAALLMIMGIAMFAMITGVVTFKLANAITTAKHCARCDHEIQAGFSYCPYCGRPQPVGPNNGGGSSANTGGG